jgi:hypothetical protein
MPRCVEVVCALSLVALCGSNAHAQTQPIDPQLTPRSVARIGKNVFVVTKPLFFRLRDGDDTLAVPVGFLTDLASIPKALHWWHGKVDESMGAAIVHDYLYWYQPCERDEADAVMYMGMLGANTGRRTREWIYRAVSDRGLQSYERNRQRRDSGEVRKFTATYTDSILGRFGKSNEELSDVIQRARDAGGLEQADSDPYRVRDWTARQVCRRAMDACEFCRYHVEQKQRHEERE